MLEELSESTQQSFGQARRAVKYKFAISGWTLLCLRNHTKGSGESEKILKRQSKSHSPNSERDTAGNDREGHKTLDRTPEPKQRNRYVPQSQASFTSNRETQPIPHSFPVIWNRCRSVGTSVAQVTCGQLSPPKFKMMVCVY